MYDPVQLRSFLIVAELSGFTRAAQRLGLGQPTVSQHVRKLEEAVGRPLLRRDTHTVELTVDGEAMVGFAEEILAAQDRARRHFAADRVRGRVRFGVSDDLVRTHLPAVLRAFGRSYPGVEVALTVDLSGTLHRRLDAGDLDLVFAKRPATKGPLRGRTVWRDRLVWVGAPDLRLDPADRVPLLVYPPPSIARARALAALRRDGRAYRFACVSGSLDGLIAAGRAGLGVMAHSAGMVPDGLVPVAPSLGLPDLGPVDVIVVHRTDPPAAPVRALTDAIVAARGGRQTD